MSALFEPTRVGSMALTNRVVMAPLTRNRAPGAVPTSSMATYYSQRANPTDGAGLIITEATAISQQGQGYSNVPGLWSFEQVSGWRNVTEAVHAQGGRIVVQLWHVGRISHTSLQPGGQAPVAPSAIRAAARTYLVDASGKGDFVETSSPRALSEDELPGIVDDYRLAARNAMAAGFDGVEVHAANGYLIDQFLRSGSNQRIDAWGGSIENRVRFMYEVVRAVVQELGAGRVGVRLSPVTPTNDANDPEPQLLFEAAVRQLAHLDLAYVHILEGHARNERDFRQGGLAFDYASLREAYRQAGGTGAWMLNNGYADSDAEQAIEDGRADLISFGRPFIANPDLTARMRDGVPLAEPDPTRFYGGGDDGYIDYPQRLFC